MIFLPPKKNQSRARTNRLKNPTRPELFAPPTDKILIRVADPAGTESLRYCNNSLSMLGVLSPWIEGHTEMKTGRFRNGEGRTTRTSNDRVGEVTERTTVGSWMSWLTDRIDRRRSRRGGPPNDVVEIVGTKLQKGMGTDLTNLAEWKPSVVNKIKSTTFMESDYMRAADQKSPDSWISCGLWFLFLCQ